VSDIGYNRACRIVALQVAAIAVFHGAAFGAAHAGALVDAVERGDAAAVEQLLSQGANANDANADGTSALHWAVHRDDMSLVGLLLDSGAGVESRNRYGVSPLFLACENGNARLVELLLDRGADPNSASPDGETVLMTAARTGDVGTLRALIAAGANVNAQEGWRGQTALMWAAAENNVAAVELLVEAGAKLSATSSGDAFRAFTFAVRHGAVDATRALIGAGANVNDTLPDGTSMLVLAVMNAHYELASVLLEHGADPNADAQGWTALHQIAWSRRWNMGFNLPGPKQTGNLDSLDLARDLVAGGADVNARQKAEPIDGNRNKLNRVGATAFLLAAKAADLPYMRTLLELGADPAITTEEGTTALMAAAGVGIWAPGENPGTH
jgi:ankyrin repeat protein